MLVENDVEVEVRGLVDSFQTGTSTRGPERSCFLSPPESEMGMVEINVDRSSDSEVASSVGPSNNSPLNRIFGRIRVGWRE